MFGRKNSTSEETIDRVNRARLDGRSLCVTDLYVHVLERKLADSPPRPLDHPPREIDAHYTPSGADHFGGCDERGTSAGADVEHRRAFP